MTRTNGMALGARLMTDEQLAAMRKREENMRRLAAQRKIKPDIERNLRGVARAREMLKHRPR